MAEVEIEIRKAEAEVGIEVGRQLLRLGLR